MALAIRLGNRSPNHAMWPKCQTQNETETGGNKKKGEQKTDPTITPAAAAAALPATRKGS